MLTKRQRKILDFIKAFVERRGYAPTLQEIGRHFGLSSPATVHKHLRKLEEKGMLRRRWNQRRAIEVLPEEGRTPAYELPLVGELEQGCPVDWLNADEAVPVPPGLMGEGRTYVLRVRGSGFAEELVRDGDFLVVEEAEQLSEDTLGLLLLTGNQPVLTRYRKQGSRLRLTASLPGSGRCEVEASEVRVRGRVVGILRKY